jgi:hypothetical protein
MLETRTYNSDSVRLGKRGGPREIIAAVVDQAAETVSKAKKQVQEEWIIIRTALMKTLWQFPEAKKAVMETFRELSGQVSSPEWSVVP